MIRLLRRSSKTPQLRRTHPWTKT